jgi:hypothetical protein
MIPEARMGKSERKKRYPSWLTETWEVRKSETADRVLKAIASLNSRGVPVTLAKICGEVKSIYGISISPTTIKRNHLANEAYRANRNRSGAVRFGDPDLVQLCANTPDADRPKLLTKISRLRRNSKDSLIVKVIQLDQSNRDREKVENSLREEILKVNVELIALKQQLKKAKRGD